jgi:pimeloyl-ACP methyl ester carboxylesterase
VEGGTAAQFFGTVELSNRLRLPYVEQGSPSGVPLVLVHAVGDSWRSFERVLCHLPESIHAFALTLRGHGDAARPESGYRSSDFAGDLAGFLGALGLEAAVIVGGSSGGLVAQRFAIDRPDRTLGLVLLGSPLSLGNKPGARKLWDSTFSKLTDPIDPDFVRGFVESTVVRPVPDAFLNAMVRESLKVPAQVWKATVKGLLEDDFSRELGSIQAPTLVAWGDRDTILPREEQERLAAGIPNARLLVYPGSGHAFYWEDPARVASDLTAFVEEIAS